MINENLHLKRTTIIKTKGQIELPLGNDETKAQNNIPDELNNLLSVVLEKKYIGGYDNENT